jgi:microcystin degradation protein MlrC
LYSAGDLVFVVCCTDPHIDSRSRAVEAVRIIADTIDGHIKPTMALAKPPIIPLVNMQFTARGFARELVERLSALEHAAEIAVRVPYCVLYCFWSDHTVTVGLLLQMVW